MSALPRSLLATLFLTLLLSACATRQAPPPVVKVEPRRTAELAFDLGVRRYEGGRYGVAALWLDEAIELGLDKPSAMRAHKLRAFIECIAGRSEPCKKHFRKIIELDPAFELVRAEAGHPMWGPAFREVREEFAAAATTPAQTPQR